MYLQNVHCHKTISYSTFMNIQGPSEVWNAPMLSDFTAEDVSVLGNYLENFSVF